MSQDSDDPLAAFRSGETQVSGISRKIAGHISPAAFRQISQSATSDQMAGDPHHYAAYGPGDRSQERLQIRPKKGPWHSPSYRYLIDIVYDPQGKELVLVYSALLVKIAGRNLQSLYEALFEGTCAFVQEYHPTRFTPPGRDEPIIEFLELVVRGVEEEPKGKK
ncbi:hypothetical protein [Thermogemmatispora carboxidivorans]|uniref:hypothetical protein n=1 Tax=Thermogemmatispora carboxidivorans TaxID=1382306 RepID=UPI00069A5ACF|nr:hypothetical protein [Thermogemmatispora carboxidivorans]